MREFRMRSCALSTISVIVATLTSLSPIPAQVNTGGDVQVSEVPHFEPLTAEAVATAPPAAITSATVGYQVSSYPCFGCVAGGAIGIPTPEAVITHGSLVAYTVLFSDASYTGACSVAISITRGFTIVDSASVILPSGCKAGYIYYISFSRTAYSKTGAETLRATLAAGSTTSVGSQKFFVQ